MAEWKDEFELEPSLYSAKIVHATTPMDHVVLNIKTDRDLTLLKEKLKEDGFKKTKEEKNLLGLRKQEKKLTITVDLKELQNANEILMAFDCAKTNKIDKLKEYVEKKWFYGKIRPILKRSWVKSHDEWDIERKENLIVTAHSTNDHACIMAYTRLDLRYIRKKLLERGFKEGAQENIIHGWLEGQVKKLILTCELKDVSEKEGEEYDKELPMIVLLKANYGTRTPPANEQDEWVGRMREFYWDTLKPLLAKAPTAKQ